jgi:two-component system, NtrC family, sensor kinase
MRIATRIAAVSTLTVAVLTLAFGWISLTQQERHLVDAHLRETAALARTVARLAAPSLRESGVEGAADALAEIASDEGTYAILVLGPEGVVRVSGPPLAEECLWLEEVLAPQRSGKVRGSAECDGAVDWVAVPLDAAQPGETTLVLARHASFVEVARTRAIRSTLLTCLSLALGGALIVWLVIRRSVLQPLAQVTDAVRRLDGPLAREPLVMRHSPPELTALISAFNRMVDRLERQRRIVLQEVSTRVQFESKVREAEKFAAMGRLSAGLAHEIGSPLGVIAFRAEAIVAGPSSNARRQAAEILHETDRISDLIRGLKQITLGGAVPIGEVDLAAVVRDVCHRMDHMLLSSGITLKLELPAEPAVVRGDGSLLRHALRNLLSNAAHALRDYPGPREIRVTFRRDEGMFFADISDSGPGIPTEQLPHVFEPFFTTKKVGEGMGLGLAISRGIVEKHGGSLTLQSSSGCGVTATLALPSPEKCSHEQEMGHDSTPADARSGDG